MRPATGFSADLKTLLSLSSVAAVQRRGIMAPKWRHDDDEALGRLIRDLRAQGERVIYALPGQKGDALAMACDRRIEQQQGRWQVVPVT